ncbi:methionine synthase [Haloactinomyces albus]|uniref:Methionine synthase II (Cobalamin-independent) n=1 Tax=Haloactinomyces albus TaxID=1352928 RepID=A0AAE3ZCB5_9ACTN|nr:methionine synthase [Haloactinomyces albus]MDR7301081.1 methionine synthase II (cobalamin-independent) [Haloactinomyces albus]
MTETPWTPGTATAIGSMPGTDPYETTRLVAGELPGLTPLPELPERGVGADLLGRAAGLLLDLPVEVVPSGYRVAARAGRDQRRAVDLLRWDLDALQTISETEGPLHTVKVQAAGPWTLSGGIELERGHRVLTDHGALRDFTESLIEGLIEHAGQVSARTGARVLVQLDEPTLPAVLHGGLPTPSGYGHVPAVPEPEVQRLLSEVIDRLGAATGSPVVVHCCASRPPVGLLRRAGAGAIALDATGLDSMSATLADELGEAWEEDLTLLLGLVPNVAPTREPTVRDLARPAQEMAARLGFHRRMLAERSMPTPACGLGGAAPEWARRALRMAADLGRLFRDEAEN